jgi:hypothetical protein
MKSLPGEKNITRLMPKRRTKMNNTHGDLLYRSDTSSSPRPDIMDYICISDVKIPEDIGGGHPDPVGDPGTPGPAGIPSHSNYQAPRGKVGWICPVCGRVLAPSTSYCPCNLTRNITCLNSGVTIKDVLDNAIDCNSTPPEAHYTTATNTSK